MTYPAICLGINVTEGKLLGSSLPWRIYRNPVVALDWPGREESFQGPSLTSFGMSAGDRKISWKLRDGRRCDKHLVIAQRG